jgi:hypothetical protein
MTWFDKLCCLLYVPDQPFPPEPDYGLDTAKLPDLSGSKVAYRLKSYTPPKFLQMGSAAANLFGALVGLLFISVVGIVFMIPIVLMNRRGKRLHEQVLAKLAEPPEPLPPWGTIAQALNTSTFPDEKNHLYAGQIVGTEKPALIHRGKGSVSAWRALPSLPVNRFDSLPAIRGFHHSSSIRLPSGTGNTFSKKKWRR